MAGKIQALFNQYQQKYPLYTREAIAELMLDDGVITYDVAKKIKSGVSLFLLDNDSFKTAKNNDFSMTEIMGGNFSKTKTKPKSNFNRKIEHTFQSTKQGDCWLLSDINALSYKDWGRKAIYDAIVPDEDGSGGVTIKFKGSPLKLKEIHITAFQIDEARRRGNYADGDDDMIAFELATEQTFRKMIRLGVAKRAGKDEDIQKDGGQYRSFIYLGVTTDEFDQYPISELLGIKTKEVCFDVPSMKNNKLQLLKLMSDNKKNISAVCSFDFEIGGYGDENTNDYIHGHHAYAIKDFQYGKEVTLINPYISNYDIKIPWQIFLEHIYTINLSCKDTKTENIINGLLPKNYQKDYKKYFEQLRQTHRERWEKYNQEQEVKKAEEEKKQQQELAAKNAEKQREINDKKNKTIEMLNNAYKNNDKKELFMSVCKIDSDIVVDILEQFPTLIEKCDKAYWGWGNGRQKRYIISNIINSLCNKSKEVGIDSKIIENFKNKCDGELDAIIYTDEKVIQSEVEKMVKLIKSKS